jgi:hypothetical protein
LLLVIAPDPKVEIWAHGPFGQLPGLMLEPIVLSYADVPEHLDEEVAQRFPELAVLAAIAHPTNDAIAQQALRAIAALDSDRNGLYFDILKRELPHLRRSSLEAAMVIVNGQKYYSDFMVEHLSRGIAEGRLTALRGVAIDLARSKLGELPEPSAAMIRALQDDAVVNRLVLALGHASSAEQVRLAIKSASVQ